jgi:hypothetical protein
MMMEPWDEEDMLYFDDEELLSQTTGTESKCCGSVIGLKLVLIVGLVYAITLFSLIWFNTLWNTSELLTRARDGDTQLG